MWTAMCSCACWGITPPSMHVSQRKGEEWKEGTVYKEWVEVKCVYIWQRGGGKRAVAIIYNIVSGHEHSSTFIFFCMCMEVAHMGCYNYVTFVSNSTNVLWQLQVCSNSTQTVVGKVWLTPASCVTLPYTWLSASITNLCTYFDTPLVKITLQCSDSTACAITALHPSCSDCTSCATIATHF